MPLDYDKLRNWPIPESVQTYTAHDTILYALGVGAATENPPQDPQFVYERGLQALPTMAVVLAGGGFWLADPALGIDLARMLHGEQFLRLHKPLPATGTLVGRHAVEEIYDKGADKGAVMFLARRLYEQATDELVAEVRMSIFLRGTGGFGGTAEGQPKPHPVPTDRAPDATLDLITRPEQAALYRLAGADPNPIHIDAGMARRAGFERPILHGLCSYGVAGRAVLKLLCGNEPEKLRRFDLRFASPVYPGETLRTEVWREGPGRAAFQVRVVERDLLVLSNGCAEFDA
ncbi:MAG: MaoC/PaaZ C-terminal domain-containing protein [Rubrivivax sp.]|nr:MaoC/PaaZ C-terminal domain-containing protein [Rubrivivax sp.]